MAEATLDVIIKNSVSGTAAVAQEKTAVSELGGVTATTAEKTKAHAAAANLAAKEERDLTVEARESAKAMGELGAKGGELVDRFSALTTAAGGLQGTLMGVGLLAAGALVEGAIKVDEVYREQVKASADLKQATDATGTSYEDLSKQFEDFAAQNQSFIANQNEAKDVLATFIRAGFDAKDAMTDLGIALDLASLKHEDLTTAGTQTLLMLEGQGRVAKQLGIDIKGLTSSDENATKAEKDLTKANDEVTKAQQNLATANEALKVKEDELSGKRKETKADLDQLAAKHDSVTKATDALSTAQANQKQAQGEVNTATSTAVQIQQQLKDKLDGGRNAQDQQQQSTNRLNAEWDKFAHDVGPTVESVYQGLINLGGTLVGVLDDIYNAASNVNSALNAAQNAIGGAAGSAATSGAPPSLPHGVRAAGGPVLPGGTYTVGEAGPETLVMGSSGGYVIPGGSGMDDTNELLAAILHAIIARGANPFSTAAFSARG